MNQSSENLVSSLCFRVKCSLRHYTPARKGPVEVKPFNLSACKPRKPDPADVSLPHDPDVFATEKKRPLSDTMAEADKRRSREIERWGGAS